MNTVSTDATTPGALLAQRYRVLGPLGAGGMAHVVLARDERLARRVAIKVLRAEHADPTARERARVETRLLASMNHPNLVTLFDAHLDHDPQFFVMEHVDGAPLSQRLGRGRLDPSELRALATDLTDGLAAVHAAGIVHRDVKPSNILLDPVGAPSRPFRAKLADFGIAHLVESERLTGAHTVIGTAEYLAPEQLTGAAPAPASDVYSLGLVLLEAATGRRAFGGPSEGNPLFARLAGDPEIPTWLDERWAGLLRWMTARRPDDRPDAHEVRGALPAGSSSQPLNTAASRAAQADLVTAAVASVDTSAAATATAAVTAAPATATAVTETPIASTRPAVVPAIRRRPARRPVRAPIVWATVGAAAITLAAAGTFIAFTPGPADLPPVVDHVSNDPAEHPTIDEVVSDEPLDDAPAPAPIADSDEGSAPAPDEGTGSVDDRTTGPGPGLGADRAGAADRPTGPGQNNGNGNGNDGNNGNGNGRDTSDRGDH